MSESINQSEEYQKLKAQYDKLNIDWLALDKENETLKKQNQNLKWGMERYQRCVDDVSKQEGKYNAMTHEQIAGEVRMLDRMQLNHEAICCAGRDRIIYLADLVADLTDVVEQTLPQNLLVINKPKFEKWLSDITSNEANKAIEISSFILNLSTLDKRVHLGETSREESSIEYRNHITTGYPNDRVSTSDLAILDTITGMGRQNGKNSESLSEIHVRFIGDELFTNDGKPKINNFNSHDEERIGDGLLNLGHREHMKSLKTMSAQDFDDILKINALVATSKNIKDEIDNSWFIKTKDKMSPAKKLLERKRLERLGKLNVK